MYEDADLELLYELAQAPEEWEQSMDFDQLDEAELIDLAREWLLDCGADEDLVMDATDKEVRSEVHLKYDRGWSGFVMDTES